MKRIYTGDEWFGPFQEGDQDAFNWMFGLYYKKILQYAENLLQMDPKARDIVQDVFAKMINRTSYFQRAKHVQNFLYRVTRNECSTYLRNLIPQQKYLKQQEYFAQTAGGDFEANELYNERRKKMYDAMAKLPEQDRIVLEMGLAKKSKEEIAAALQVNIDHLPVRKSRAIKALKAIIFG